MALDRHPLPVDWVVSGYNALLAGVWASWVPAPFTAPICAAHVVAAFLPALVRRADAAGPSATMQVVLDLYPLLLLFGFWTELGLLHALSTQDAHDPLVAALDLRLFGVHLNAVWMRRMPSVWLSEIMEGIYFAYYPVVLGPPLVAALTGRRDALRDMTLRLLVTYIGCYVVYLAFPVDGPAYTAARHSGAVTEGLLYRLNHLLHHAGDSRGTAFPSSHVAGVIAIAWSARRWFARPVAWLFTIEAVGVVFATVYTQNHYAVDALAGVVWGLGLQLVTVPALTQQWRRPTGIPWPALPLAPRPAVPRFSESVP